MHDFDTMTEGELRAHFNALAHKVNEHLPAGTGFIVLAAPFGKDGVAQYVANVQPQDAAKPRSTRLACGCATR